VFAGAEVVGGKVPAGALVLSWGQTPDRDAVVRATVGVVDAESGEHRLGVKIAQGKGLLAPELAAQGGLPVGHRQGFGSADARQAWFGRGLGPGSGRGIAQWGGRHGKARQGK
jgi:hypothetical protein